MGVGGKWKRGRPRQRPLSAVLLPGKVVQMRMHHTSERNYGVFDPWPSFTSRSKCPENCHGYCIINPLVLLIHVTRFSRGDPSRVTYIWAALVQQPSSHGATSRTEPSSSLHYEWEASLQGGECEFPRRWKILDSLNPQMKTHYILQGPLLLPLNGNKY